MQSIFSRKLSSEYSGFYAAFPFPRSEEALVFPFFSLFSPFFSRLGRGYIPHTSQPVNTRGKKCHPPRPKSVPTSISLRCWQNKYPSVNWRYRTGSNDAEMFQQCISFWGTIVNTKVLRQRNSLFPRARIWMERNIVSWI